MNRDHETLYRRVQCGKRVRYEPAGVDWGRIMLENGAHLVQILPNAVGHSTSITRLIDPDCAAVLAAIRNFEHELVEILRNEYRQKPTTPMTKKQREAWARFESESGLCSVTLSGPDAWTAVRKAADFLAGPAVKESLTVDGQTIGTIP